MSEPTTTTEITVLPPADRAALALNSTKTEADLNQLAESLKAIKLVNSPAGREQAHSMAMTARTARTTIEKAAKDARDDATKFSKAVIAEERRLIDIIQPEETRVLGLRNAWDAAEAARKEAEAQKERDRIAAHQAVIDRIKSMPSFARDARTSATALQMLETLSTIDTSKLEEFAESAQAAKLAAEEQITEIIEAKKAAEAEQARIKAEQEAEAARLAQERQRIEAERAEAARLAAEQQAELLAMQARMKAQQDELDRQAAELAARKAEEERRVREQQAEERERLRQVELAQATLLVRQAEAQTPAVVLADKPGEALEQTAPEVLASAPSQPEPINVAIAAAQIQVIGGAFITHGQAIPTAVDLANTIANTHGVPQSKAIEWLAHRAEEFKTLAESQA